MEDREGDTVRAGESPENPKQDTANASVSPRGKVLRRAYRFLRSAIIIYSLVHVGLFFLQRRLLYLPYQDCVLSEKARSAGVQEVWLETRDGLRLAAWYWPAAIGEGSESTATAIIFHGNAGHRGHRLRWLRELHQMGLGALVFDYRGYGDNPGSPDEEGLYLDGKSAIDWVTDKVGGPQIYFGYSLGSGVAIEMARIAPPAALVLQAPFLSVPHRASELYPYLWVGPLTRDRFENVDKISGIGVPKLFIHGDHDEVVPLHHGERLFELSKEPKELWIREGFGHDGLVDGEAYRTRVREFLVRHGVL